MSAEPLVSVVIPAHNAAATLDETLVSVRAQTHQALEIIVVDDGSSDQTDMIAARHAAADARVRILPLPHSGLAAARNAGWRSARSELVAFVDADDLWAPVKIERQVRALEAAGTGAGLAYCWYARIDPLSNVESLWDGVGYNGHVLPEILAGNFIGNGSSALVRTHVLAEIDGFESALRDAGAEGCEDWLAYCRIAERYDFVVVPEHLLGYRFHPQSMSANRPRMLRSWIMVQDIMLARQPAYARVLERGVRDYASWLVQSALSVRAFGQIPALVSILYKRYPAMTVRVTLFTLPASLAGKLWSRLQGKMRRSLHTAPGQAEKFAIGVPVRQLAATLMASGVTLW